MHLVRDLSFYCFVYELMFDENSLGLRLRAYFYKEYLCLLLVSTCGYCNQGPFLINFWFEVFRRQGMWIQIANPCEGQIVVMNFKKSFFPQPRDIGISPSWISLLRRVVLFSWWSCILSYPSYARYSLGPPPSLMGTYLHFCPLSSYWC